MNKVFLMGNLTKDPEIRYTQSGKACLRFAIGVTKPVKNQDGKYEADFFNIVAWEKTAELIARYCAKGSKILIEGRLQTSSYEKNGEKKISTEISAERIEFAGSSGGQKTNSGKDNSEEDYDMPF